MKELFNIFKGELFKTGLFLGILSIAIVYIMITTGRSMEDFIYHIITLFEFQ